MSDQPHPADFSVTRRSLVAGALGAAAFGMSAAARGAVAAEADTSKTPPTGKKYAFKKSINLWAFPYPQKMSLEQCLRLAKDAGFDGIELNYDLDNDLSPKHGPTDYAR
ncbi:MAG: hypothetical protein JNK76_10505, partial [Planctomycetales bacterium]|nr:hypothetical protein [Planctomycetales bacterium]